MIIVGCAHLPASDYGGGVTPSTSPSSSSSPTSNPSSTPGTPGPCPTQDVTDTNVIYVSVNPDVTPTKDPGGNQIFGYAPWDINGGANVPGASATIPMTSTQLLQFVNTDTNPNNISHSAVGFTTNGFPPVPFTFPSGSSNPIGTALTTTPSSGNGSPWSTGEIAPNCFSQVFSAKAGTYYFGDFDTFNSAASMRDEVIVTP